MWYQLVSTNKRKVTKREYKIISLYIPISFVTKIYYYYKHIRIKLSTYDLSKGLPKNNPYELSVFESITVNNGLEVRYQLD